MWMVFKVVKLMHVCTSVQTCMWMVEVDRKVPMKVPESTGAVLMAPVPVPSWRGHKFSLVTAYMCSALIKWKA